MEVTTKESTTATKTTTSKKKGKKHPPVEQPEDMDISTNLKRRGDSGDSTTDGVKSSRKYSN